MSCILCIIVRERPRDRLSSVQAAFISPLVLSGIRATSASFAAKQTHGSTPKQRRLSSVCGNYFLLPWSGAPVQQSILLLLLVSRDTNVSLLSCAWPRGISFISFTLAKTLSPLINFDHFNFILCSSLSFGYPALYGFYQNAKRN